MLGQSVFYVPGIFVKNRLTIGDDFRDDGEAVTGGTFGGNGTVLALRQLTGVFGHCHCLRPDLHNPFSFTRAMGIVAAAGLSTTVTINSALVWVTGKRRNAEGVS